MDEELIQIIAIIRGVPGDQKTMKNTAIAIRDSDYIAKIRRDAYELGYTDGFEKRMTNERV